MPSFLYPRFAHRAQAALLSSVVVAMAAFAADPAEPPLYKVEIVIFRANNPLGIAEDWNAAATQAPAPTSEEPEADSEPAPEPARRLSFNPLPSSEFKLAGTDSALRRSPNYGVLAHVAWTQAATARNSALGVSLAGLGVADQTLRGHVALEQGRYLYLDLDLSWAPSDPPSSLLGGPNFGQPVTFTLKQKRRVRPFEQHYFDHPAFGVIALVVPVK